MLTSMRNGLNSFLVLFLLGLLISSFAIWGIGDIFTSRSMSVATVGEKELTADRYLREFQSRLRGFQAQFGPEFDTDQAVSLGVHRLVLNEMIQRSSLDEEARLLGLAGSPTSVAKAIREMDVFHDPSGNFSNYSYEQALKSAGLSAQAFEKSMLDEHARAQLVDTVMTANPVPKALVDTLYTFRKEKRQAKILNIQTSDIGTIDEPDDAALQADFEQFKNYYMRPEYRNLQFLLIDPLNFSNEVEFSEDALLEAYDERINQYLIPETREVQLLVLDDEETANEIYARTQGGETLVEIARDLLDFTIEDITLGETDFYNLEIDYNEVAADRVFTVATGGTTAPTQTMFGWHVFQVTKINAATETRFADVRGELIAELSSIAGYDAVYEVVERIEDSIAAGNDMDTVLEETGLSAINIPEIDRNGLNKDGSLTADAEKILPFLATGFSALPGDELILQSYGEAGYYLVQVNNVVEPELKPYEEVAGEVRTRWYNNERIRRAGVLANETLIAAQNGKSLDELAQNFNASVIETDILQRDQARGNLEITRPVFDLIFSLNKGEVDMERSSTNDGYLLIQVSTVVAGIPNEDDIAYQELKQTLSAEISQGLIVEYQKAVAESLGITVNDQLLEDLFNGGVVGSNIPGQF